MGLECDLVDRYAKLNLLAEQTGAVLRPLAPGLVPAGLAAALVGLWLSSYWVTVLGMATAIYALVAATNPRERTARQALSPQER